MGEMKECCVLLAFLSTLGLSLCSVVNVFPEDDQILPINSPVNITFSCNVSTNSMNSEGTLAIWEVADRQIPSGDDNPVRRAFESIGVFLEQDTEAFVHIIVSREARLQYRESGLTIRCTAFTPSIPPVTIRGKAITIRTYGQPDIPGNIQLEVMKSTLLRWERPTNIPSQVPVNYRVQVQSSTTQRQIATTLSNQTQISIDQLEMELRDSGICHHFNFSVVAQVEDVTDSAAAVIMDTIPLSSDVRSIESSVRVDSVLLTSDGIVAALSFKAIESCSETVPVRNYSLLVNGSAGSTIVPSPGDVILTGSLTTADLPLLVRDTMFQVGLEACSDVACRRSQRIIPLNTSDVQVSRVVFFGNNVFLTCSFAGGSEARGCRFIFQVNQNASDDEELLVLRSEGGQQCSSTLNQRSAYVNILVVDVEGDGDLGELSLSLVGDAVLVVESEDDYGELTGCSVEQDVTDNRVVSIVASVVVAVFLLAFVLVLVVIGVLYIRFRRKKKPKFMEISESPDTLLLEVKTDTKKILKNSPLTQRSALRSLPVTSQPLNIRPTASLPDHFSGEQAPLSFLVPPERAPPIEVVMDRDTVKVSLNKPALRAMARFQMMAKRHAEASEGSVTSEEALSLLPTTNYSRVRLTEDFKSLCCELPPLEEGGEEERELRSWCIINSPPSSPDEKQQDTDM